MYMLIFNYIFIYIIQQYYHPPLEQTINRRTQTEFGILKDTSTVREAEISFGRSVRSAFGV